MTQEEKDLLLKDLCGRLPYNVKVRGVFLNYNTNKDKILHEECDKELSCQDLKRYESLKPYLRPISSMTEEELKELAYKILQQPDLSVVKNYKTLDISFTDLDKVMNWLNAHHFDYRGLIERGLGIDCTGLNIY